MKSMRVYKKSDLIVLMVCALSLLAVSGAIGDGGRRRAKKVICHSQLMRWAVIWRSFADDNAGYFMSRNDSPRWVDTLEPYCPHPKLLLCPEARKTYAEGARNPFMAWDIERNGLYKRSSYVVNLWISNRDLPEYWKTLYVADGSQAPILLDGQTENMEPHPEDQPPAHEEDLWTPGPFDEMRRACISRHKDGVNTLFQDLSVRKVGLKQLWKLKWHRNWPEDAPLPVWPQWMSNFKEP